jgi:hypothetical protein
MKSSRGFAISILIVIAAARVMLAQWPKYPRILQFALKYAF